MRAEKLFKCSVLMLLAVADGPAVLLVMLVRVVPNLTNSV
jgi:hypothetical protein